MQANEAASARADDRRMLAESVDDFARRATDVARVRKWRGVEPGFDRGLWREIAGMGWTGLLIPERCGGMALGFGEMAEVCRGLARVLAPEPVLTCAVLAARALVHAQNDKLGAELLSGIASGATIAALAWQEAAGDLGSRAFGVRAGTSGGSVTLTGEKRYVAGAAGADGFVVAAAGDAGTMLVWVPAAAVGSGIALEAMADGRYTASLRLDGVSVPEANVLARGEIARAALDRAIDEATAMASAELLGVMSRAFDMTMDYLRTRVQFGRPIGSFQALQHRSVDLYIQQQLSTVVLNDAVDALDERPEDPGTAAAVSRAKARCSDAASLITRQAIQMHGGIGFTEDADVGLYVKRALILSASLGNSAYHRRRFLRLAPADAE